MGWEGRTVNVSHQASEVKLHVQVYHGFSMLIVWFYSLISDVDDVFYHGELPVKCSSRHRARDAENQLLRSEKRTLQSSLEAPWHNFLQKLAGKYQKTGHL